MEKSLEHLYQTKAELSHTHTGSQITGTVPNADTVDGKHAADFAAASHTHGNADITDLDWSKISSKPTTLGDYGITDAVPSSDVATTATANKILKLNSSGQLPASITGNAATASSATTAASAAKLTTAKTIAISGKVVGTATSFDGSANISIAVTAVTADSCTGNAATATTATTATSATTALNIPTSDVGGNIWIA